MSKVKQVKRTNPNKSVKVTPSLKKLTDDLNKKFGNNAVNLGFPKDSSGNVKKIERISTGSFSLDVALGGGIPVGRFTEISGAYSSTKTTQSLLIVANAQKMGYVCALIDVEATTDEDYLKTLGVDSSTLLYSQPDGMEEATQLILDMQKSGEVHLAVLDSIAALCPNKEQETAMEDSVRMGIPQQLLGEFFRKYQANNNRLVREGKKPFTLIGINQLREKIGAYGDPEYTPGGRAKGFTSSVDLRLRRGDWIAQGKGDNKEVIGQVVKFKIDKNKTFKRMQVGEFDFYFSENDVGVPVSHNDYEKDVIMCAVEWGVIEKAGSWFMFGDKKYQGVNALTQALREDPDLIEALKNSVLEVALVGGND